MPAHRSHGHTELVIEEAPGWRVMGIVQDFNLFYLRVKKSTDGELVTLPLTRLVSSRFTNLSRRVVSTASARPGAAARGQGAGRGGAGRGGVLVVSTRLASCRAMASTTPAQTQAKSAKLFCCCVLWHCHVLRRCRSDWKIEQNYIAVDLCRFGGPGHAGGAVFTV